MKNQQMLLIGLVVLVVIGAGGYFVLFANKSQQEAPQPTPSEEKVLTMSPEEIGLTLTASADNKKVIMEVAKTDDVTSLAYELTYLAQGELPRGVVGELEVKKKGKSIKQEITLGTCSDVCHYDEDVSDIKLVLKVTKTDGSVYQVEQTLEL